MAADLAPGTEFAGCVIEDVAGRGGMGVIYRATQLRLGRPVALKLIAGDRASDPEFRERFEREARLTASIEHPNVIPVHAAGEEDGHLYLVMRWVAGTDLQHLLRESGRLSPSRAAAIVAQVASALDAAHAAGLVHRDVKPANVLLDDRHVYLSDFGLTTVQSADARITESGQWMGTVDFTSPEHLAGGRTDARSDVYALGCVLHAALTGEPPFRRATVPATILAHLDDPPPLPSQTDRVPAAFDAVVARALAKAPHDRWPSAGALGRAALAAAAGTPITEVSRSVARGEAAPGGHPSDQPTRVVPAVPAAPPTSATRVAPASSFGTVVADRVPAAGKAPPPPPPPPTPEPPDFRRRRGAGVVVALLAVGAAVLAGLLVAALVGDDGDRPTGPLSRAEVTRVARSFASAYTGEDGTALRRLLATDVRRVAPGERQEGRDAVVAEYVRQFETDEVQRYALTDLDVSGGRAGRAAGRYVVTRAGRAPITGDLVLAVVRQDGRPRIALIAAEPRG